jgi:membrane-bound metal-dependent hydrolase YbcI (DUF457 family)
LAGYKGHIGGAIVIGSAYLATVSLTSNLLHHNYAGLSTWQLAVGLIVVSILFGLWPDIDTNSKGQDIFFGGAFIFDIILIVMGEFQAAAYLGLLAMTPIVGKHRGWTHSKLAMLLVPAPLLIASYIFSPSNLSQALVVYGASVAGYFSHLLLDGKIFSFFRVKA